MKALMINITVPNYLALQALGRLNRRFFYQGMFSTVKLADVPEPILPNPDWVKVRVGLCGFCGSDLNLIQVKDSPMASPFTSFPCIFGHEVFGVVTEIGSSVRGCKPGDRVTINPGLSCAARGCAPECPACAAGRPGSCEKYAEGAFSPGMFTGICRDIGGGFAESMVVHESQVYKVPHTVSDESASLTEPLAVGIQAVLDNRPMENDRVLVIGGGVIGAMIVKAIRGLGIGCSITVAEPSAFSGEYARRSGADHVIQENLIGAAEKITGARAYKPMLGERIVQGGFHRVFDTVGHSPTLQAALIVAAAGGTISLVGIGNKLTFDPTPLWLKLQTLKGCYAYGFNDTENGRRHAFEIAIELMERKKVEVQDMLTHTFTIEQYRDLIGVNMSKARHNAIKTAVRFD
ncbi:MAG: alcohol dehydrogenase [Desulfobacteraceae bacterium]|nr:MAG: alcohol dehydrogenase [Desulfobacteraceae bacterium]